MKNLKNKQNPNFLLDLSFVMCSCAKQPPAKLDKLDTKCFEYYRILKATDNNNGVFGKDSPFIRDADCIPFINLDNFGLCQADNYVEAMLDIANCAYKAMGNYKIDSAQYNALYSKWYDFSNYAETARQSGNVPKENRNYHCVLELLDSWFNTDDKVKMSNKMEMIAAAKELQIKLSKNSGELTSALRSACIEYRMDKWGGGLPTFEELIEGDGKTKKDDLNLLLVGDNEETDEEKAMAKEKEELSQAVADMEALIKLVKDCVNDADSWAESGINDIVVYKADEDEDTEYIYIDDIDVILDEVISLKNKLKNALDSLTNFDVIAEKYQLLDENSKLKSLVEELYDNIDKLVSEIYNLRGEIYEKDTVTENSFLVCRCGGIIKVVQNGDWVNISKDALMSNIIDLLTYAEEYIYELYKPNITRDTKYSIIKAFNIVHGAITFLSEEETGLDYIIDEECEKARKPAAHIEITVRPAQDMLKQAKRIHAFQSVLSVIPNWIGVGFTLALAFQDFAESEKEGEEFFTLENGGTIESMGNVLYHLLYKKDSLIGDSLNLVSIVGSLITAIEDITYKSYAAFIGEIKIEVTTYKEHYTFSGNYDIFGKKEGDYTASHRPYEKSSFLINAPEDNRTKIHYKIYEDGVFETTETSDLM